ncbi:conserved hypothetical protein [Vibrio chagasii]|nr:conserved hypothetical protein [Vibrio chagasii]CAH7415128.1 conserved hypothetical protein [Vibrio chagasii]CAH7424722.1 conserved hypothetical protein [Vibrio chagasii]
MLMTVKIYFVRDSISYLPEIFAYTDFCKHNEILYEVVTPDFDFGKIYEPFIKWVIMGRDSKIEQNCFLVHEFLSLSTGKLAKIKNLIKKNTAPKPDFQVFLNSNVKKVFAVENIPSVIRDMGVMPFFKSYKNINKEFDFVYCGSLGKNRKIEELFIFFKEGALKNSSLLVIGEASDAMIEKYSASNITFIGKVDYQDVPKLLAKARCAINFIPNIYPFNLQTSTKLLEYLSCNLPVLSTRYEWVEDFKDKNNAPILFLDASLNNERVEFFLNENFIFPNMKCYSWDSILKESKVFELVLDGFYQKFGMHNEKR